MLRSCLALLFALAGWQNALAGGGFDGGHAKVQWLTSTYPDDSIFRSALGANTQDQNGELRLKFRGGSGSWSVNADYQFVARFGDSLAVGEQLDSGFFFPPPVPVDDHRWWDLTHEITESDDQIMVQRLDRLHLNYTGDKLVLRFGRQAVSWGNGLIYNPMDVFNPFDPAAVDTEYKLGDDMLYAQYLTDSGNDWQFVQVMRRDDEGDLSQQVNSSALKFHGFGGEREYDILLAEHYDELMLGVGGSTSYGGAVIRGDITVTDTDDDWVASLVASWSYSWVWAGHNVSAVTEYFYNGFGLRESEYSLANIQDSKELVDRVTRGELFTLGRHYVAGSLQIEVTPLLNVIPNLFVNLGDGSVLAQLVAQWDVGQDWQLLASLNVPVGPSGTEYGGLETGIEKLTLAAGPSLFAQLAFYF
ncbi:MAG: hypothetical protein DRR04_09840 [Gammaproteobacteria bacterium]|nr:MAG: hypothetical protein DRR04_09840 [Gammaproteobacteria bacterium]